MKDHLDFTLKIFQLSLRNDGTLYVVDTFTIEKHDLRYRAEGNANIVISVSSLQKILRLSKYDNIPALDDAIKEDRLNNIISTYKYMKCVSKFLGKELLNPSLALVETTNANLFNQWLCENRPAERCHRITIPDGSDYGLLENDAALLLAEDLMNLPNDSLPIDTFSVEIKPKQGWSILDSNILQLFNINVDNLKKCRFCAMQFLKLKQNEIENIGGYCPLDLFSGNILRMKSAILGLIKSPQNNLRIFKNGDLLYSRDNIDKESDAKKIFYDIFGDDNCCDVIGQFIELVIAILLSGSISENNKLEFAVEQTGTRSNCPEANDNCLPDNCILKSILNTQLLAKTNIYSIASKCASFSTCNDSDRIFFANHFKQNKLLNELSLADNKPYIKLTPEECYSIGATAMDCSIMLTFQQLAIDAAIPNSDSSSNVVSVHDKQFRFKSSVIDLDPKPCYKHYRKYKKSIEASYAAYTEYFDKSK